MTLLIGPGKEKSYPFCIRLYQIRF